METLRLLFIDGTTGGFSWRKALTALTGFTFSTACIGNLIANKFAELPASYVAIIAGVFIFYFGKGLLEGKQVKLVENKPVENLEN
jgi:uncharacterized membrane protein